MKKNESPWPHDVGVAAGESEPPADVPGVLEHDLLVDGPDKLRNSNNYKYRWKYLCIGLWIGFGLVLGSNMRVSMRGRVVD